MNKIVRLVTLGYGIIYQIILLIVNYEDFKLFTSQIFYSFWVLSPFIIFFFVMKMEKRIFLLIILSVGLFLIHSYYIYFYFSSESSTSALVFAVSPVYEIVILSAIAGLIYLGIFINKKIKKQ